MHPILPGGFWFVHILFDSLVKFKFLAQFTVNYLPHPVVFSLVLFCAHLLHSFPFYHHIIYTCCSLAFDLFSL